MQVKSDDKGEFAYAYQLDGTYRPNYKAELRDLAGTVVATTTFTDTNTAEIVPTGNSVTYTGWTGDYTGIDEGLSSPSCSSSDYVDSSTSNARESYTISLSSIPDGSTITSITVRAADRGNSSTEGGTYATFVRFNGVDSANSSTHTTTGTSGACTGDRTDVFDVTDAVKSGATTLEVGVVKLNSGGATNNDVRVGAMAAVITYTPLSQSDLTAVKSHTPAGNATNGIPFTWTIHVANAGNATATFNAGSTILTDNLPTGPTYGAPSVSNQVGIGGTGSISCGTITSSNLNCLASGGTGVTIASGGSFDVSFSTTPNSTTTLVNPRSGSGLLCKVDPLSTPTTGAVTESNESNNTCSESITVNAAQPDLTISKTNNLNSCTNTLTITDSSGIEYYLK